MLIVLAAAPPYIKDTAAPLLATHPLAVVGVKEQGASKSLTTTILNNFLQFQDFQVVNLNPHAAATASKKLKKKFAPPYCLRRTTTTSTRQ